ncbi:hypothetical protein N9P17_07405 [Tateyamaria sp.]|nr:hypothetical protein [Tateyamaria sp.]
MLEVFRSALSTTAMICVPAIPQAEGFSSSIYINGMVSAPLDSLFSKKVSGTDGRFFSA